MKNQKETLIQIFIILTITLTGFNLITSAADIYTRSKNAPYIFYGESFIPLRATLQNESRIGYVTDQDITSIAPLQRFLQIQYALAPTILDTKNLNQHYILLNCSDEKISIEIIKKFHLKPLKRNSFGVILAENTGH
ncbi:MAG: hypothetical protein HQL25_01295 [Candidatus Omnitrophica bacterium]|nr:hypothetical protein [Candidatus Omnitrophota bacterium]